MKARERNEIIISWLTISLAFAIIISKDFLNITDLAFALPVSLIGVGTGFIFHELAHKYVAIHYGCQAEFRLWKTGLILTLLLPIITFGSFLFAAPGAVYIYGKSISVKQNGIISAAGPATNIIIAILFGAIYITTTSTSSVAEISSLAMRINFFLAFFNMIPIFPLDGSKVFSWNPGAWIGIMGIAAAGSFFLPF